MKHPPIFYLVFITILTIMVPSFAQEEATTKDGRTVILNSDGSWQYKKKVAISRNVSDSAIETVRAYLSVNSWRERLPYILNPDTVKSAMENRYRNMELGVSKFHFITKEEPIPNNNGWVEVIVDLKGRAINFYLKNTTTGYRIDWASTVGHNEPKGKIFKAMMSTTPVKMRVEAEIDSTYYYEFMKYKEKAWSIKIFESRNYLGNGYVMKDSESGKLLFNALSDGIGHKMVLEIHYLEGGDNDSAFIISNVLNIDSWWIDPEN